MHVWGRDRNATEVKKPYTPISSPSDLECLKLLIKVYWPTETYPDGGRVTQWVDRFKENDFLEISGPVGKCEYMGLGNFHFRRLEKKVKVKKLTLVGGGTGFTPIYQLLLGLLEEKEKSNGFRDLQAVYNNRYSDAECEAFNGIEVNFLNLNKTENDILLSRQLLDLQDKQIISDLKFSVDTRTSDVDFDVHFDGLINEEKLKEVLWPPSEDHYVFYSGKTAFRNLTKGLLEGLGHENIFQY